MQRIPKTADQAVDQLASLGALVTAKEWDRAALVYALVGPATGPGRKPGNVGNPTFMKVTDLAKVGIVGLLTRESVNLYRDAWAYAVKSGKAQPVALGDGYDTPDLPWPPTRTGTDGYSSEAGATATINRIVAKHGPSVVAKAVAETPEVADAIATDLSAVKAVNEAATRTEVAKQMHKSVERGAKEREAHQDEATYRVQTFAFMIGVLEVEGAVEKTITHGLRDEDGMRVARMVAQVLHGEAARLEAWADGVDQPLTDDEFDAGIEAILGSQA